VCGIAGFLGRGDERALRAMGRAIAHRGPDGEGFWFDAAAQAGLAHRRLAIIDPTEAAAQPMSSCEGRYHITFNGEIYNFRELAADLSRRGYKFNDNSDTGVIAPLYDFYGADCLKMMNGIFAFALWDSVRKELFIARDPLGVKPLYYVRTDRELLFASELKALLTFGDWDRALDERALLSYLVQLWSPGVATPFRAVRKLLPGHFIRARLDRFAIEQWYAPPLERPAGGPAQRPETLAVDVLAVLDRAVSDQCVSDVPIGAFLSGGVDSSAIVASMVAGGHRPSQTYCIGFDGPSMADEGFGDDLTHARIMADRLGVPLAEIKIKQPTEAELRGLPWMLDEPQADPAALYVEAIAKAARADGVKVLLGGVGSDDIFSGYRRHRVAALRSSLGTLRALFPDSWPTFGVGPQAFRRRMAKFGYLLAGTDEQFLLRAFEFNRQSDAVACLTPAMARSIDTADAGYLGAVMARSSGEPLLDRMLDLELHGFLPDHNLNYTDKASMAHGIEVRVPFLDVRLVEMAQRIPWRLKTKGMQEKWILKRALAKRLPAIILKRRKTGFGAPVRSWLAQGPFRSMVDDVLSSRRFQERGLFDAAAVRTLLRDSTAERRDGAYLVFAIVMVEFWMQQFYDRAETTLAPPQPASLGAL